jgi:biotin synthase
MRRLLSQPEFSRDDIITLLSLTHPADNAALLRRADEVRRETMGDEVHIRGIIEIANVCACDCSYCGLRASNAAVERYRIPAAEILGRVRTLAGLPLRTVVLQSGEARVYDPGELAALLRDIKRECETAVTISFGQHDEASYRMWLEAGADRYLLKHETANPFLFKRLKPDSNYQERLLALTTLRRIGYQIGTGNMVGLPGQSLGDIADDILLCRQLEADMCTFGPFIPSPGTPLADTRPGSVELSLRVLAVARLVLPQAHIPANTALGTLDPDARRRALQSGCNVIMPNFTPLEYRRRYTIYPKQLPERDDARRTYDDTVAMIRSLGRSVGAGRGDSLRGH